MPNGATISLLFVSFVGDRKGNWSYEFLELHREASIPN
jgi:hypothetical protein